MIWRCADDFFKVLLKFKMAATDQLNYQTNFEFLQKTRNLFGIFFKF